MPRYLLNPLHQHSEGGVVQPKSSRLSETSKAVVFSGMLLAVAVVAVLLIRALDPPQMLAYVIWASTPLVAVLIMMFLIKGDGRTRESRALLGLHRLGAGIWWIAILGTFLISLLATTMTWATPFASFAPPASPVDTGLNFAVNTIVTILTFAAAEEIAWRGYLLPRLLQLGRNRALAITGLVHAAWPLPLVLLTSLYHSDGNLLIILPLFVATILAAGFVYGDLRIALEASGQLRSRTVYTTPHGVPWQHSRSLVRQCWSMSTSQATPASSF
jgi:membrane protease YdiL (CAAX protease family)